MRQTLVLTKSFLPVQILPFHRALRLLMLGKAELINEYDWSITTSSGEVRMPSVVRLTDSFKRSDAKRPVRFSREGVIERDNQTCQYCGKKFPLKELTLEHVVPRAQGGKTEWTNIVAACGPCNTRKADRTPRQAGMRLIKEPVVPSSRKSRFKLHLKGTVPEQWRSFCYWNEELSQDAV